MSVRRDDGPVLAGDRFEVIDANGNPDLRNGDVWVVDSERRSSGWTAHRERDGKRDWWCFSITEMFRRLPATPSEEPAPSQVEPPPTFCDDCSAPVGPLTRLVLCEACVAGRARVACALPAPAAEAPEETRAGKLAEALRDLVASVVAAGFTCSRLLRCNEKCRCSLGRAHAALAKHDASQKDPGRAGTGGGGR